MRDVTITKLVVDLNNEIDKLRREVAALRMLANDLETMTFLERCDVFIRGKAALVAMVRRRHPEASK
jgi:hypothetical protein